MKILPTMALLGLSMGLVNIAAAEPFNDRSPEWWKTLSPSERAAASTAEDYPAARLLGFKDKSAGWDWVAKISPSAAAQKPDTCPLDNLLATHSIGFNGKYNFQC